MATIGIDARLWNQTGIGRYIRNLVIHLQEIDKKNTYVLFIISTDFDDVNSVVKGGEFKIIKVNIPWHSIREQIEFPKLLNSFYLDLVHFPYFSVPIFYNKPFVVTIHDLIINHFPTGRATTLPLPLYGLKRMGYNFILSQAVKKAKKIVVPSYSTKAELLDHYGVKESRIIVTPEGVDARVVRNKSKADVKKSPYFLYVGNAYPHKNLEKTLEAFDLFRLKNPEYTFVFVGKPDYFYKRLQKFVTLTNISHVEFTGYVSDRKLAELYSSAAATVVPSLMEGFGLTALEALFMGTPVIASKIPALEEVCGKAALYFDPNSVESITTVFEKCSQMSQEDRKSLIQEGLIQSKKFTWEKMAIDTLDVYNSCLQ